MATTGDDERTVEDILQEASTTLDKSVAVTERIKASLNETRTTAAETMRDLDEQEGACAGIVTRESLS